MRRAGGFLAAAALTATLIACASPEPISMTATKTIKPELTQTEFVANDGMRLPMTSWIPTGPVTAVILAIHGFND